MESKVLDNAMGAVDATRTAKYEAAYGDYMEIARESMKTKFKYEWTANDTLAFGQYADTWQEYRPIMESDQTSVNTLGPALQSNMGLIAMSYAALPIQNLASVQPLNDEAGTIFYRKGIATTSRGNVSAGDDLINPMGAVNKDVDSYASETQVKSTAITDNTDLTYSITTGAELRPGAVRITVAGGKIKGMDDGEGHILGVGIDAEGSTVNYLTGAVELKFSNLAAKGVTNGSTIDVQYAQSVTDANVIPSMKWVLASKVVNSDYYVLQSQYSNLSEMVLRKRFGADLADQVTADLVSQITSSVMFKAIRKLRTMAVLNESLQGEALSWSLHAPTGVSDYDHRRTFDDKLIDATAMMYKLAGKGDVSALVVGSKGKQILKSSGMEVIKSAVSGPHLCGMYDGVPVYYAPNSALGDNEILVVYRGANWYEAPIVYAPFLPVTTVAGRAIQNVLTNAQAAYHSAALDSVMDGFVIRITIQTS